jgi:hypothetical protein
MDDWGALQPAYSGSRTYCWVQSLQEYNSTSKHHASTRMMHLPEDNTEKSELPAKPPGKVQAIAAVATDNWGATTLRREGQFYRKQRYGNACN